MIHEFKEIEENQDNLSFRTSGSETGFRRLACKIEEEKTSHANPHGENLVGYLD